ncbi:FecCD family ABC transporter permease [Vallitalea sp.]|jgi:iron complex transport system permease protein|uniref:FecCD family ABC transporter permease n=1 Tax=Vallitalea sp. TaxID=1882829 RepID=UPI0025ED9362|nr:iron chelate uptake ABC transporter family permease subunit [Vallitalea sp.]MCT4688745.1 iron ABC transporter permease [Vallitalea sp.]
MKIFRKSNIIISLLVLIAVVIIACGFGSVRIDFVDSSKVLLSKIPFINDLISLEGIKESHIKIIADLRLPRIILALFTGGALAVVGCSFQGVFKNPMADPFVLGISSGAALGATIGLIFNFNKTIFGFTGVSMFAFIGAMLTVLVVLRISAIGKKLPTTTLLLAGISLNYLLSALMSLMMLLNRDKLERVYLWTLGSFSTSSWKEVAIIAPCVIICSIILMVFKEELNLMLLGDETARSLGIDVNRTKKIILGISSIMVAVVVSASGIIGFVGLIIPHIIRMINGPDHKKLIPLAMLIGAIFMIVCDTIARTIISPAELSVGIITSLFGVPFFLFLLYQNKKRII